MLWFSGISNLHIFDLITLKKKIVHDVSPYYSSLEFGIITRGVSKSRGEIILLTFILNQQYWLSLAIVGTGKPEFIRVESKFRRCTSLIITESERDTFNGALCIQGLCITLWIIQIRNRSNRRRSNSCPRI